MAGRPTSAPSRCGASRSPSTCSAPILLRRRREPTPHERGPRPRRCPRAGAGRPPAPVGAPTSLPQRAAAHRAAEPHHASVAVPRAHGDPLRHRGLLRASGVLHRGGRGVRWRRRAARPRPEGHDPLRGRARLAGRFRRLRRRAGADALFLEHARDQELRLVRRHGVRHRDGVAAGALQRRPRRPRQARLGVEFLHRHAGPRRRHHGVVAALPAPVGAGLGLWAPGPWRSRSSTCSASPG